MGTHEKPGPVETKVKASTAATYLAALAGLALLNAIQADASLIAGLPDWLEAVALPAIPGGIAFLAGYRAKHTFRPDLGEPPPEMDGDVGAIDLQTALGTVLYVLAIIALLLLVLKLAGLTC